MKKLYKIILVIIGLILMADFSPVIYYNIINKHGSINIKPVDYVYDNLTLDQFLKHVDGLNRDEIITITYRLSEKHARVVFFDKEKGLFYGAEVDDRMQAPKISTEVLFCYVSESINMENAKRVNKDYDYISNLVRINRFEKVVINNLKDIKPTLICVPKWNAD